MRSINSKKDLKILIKNSQTPGGLNEKAVKRIKKSLVFINY